MIRVTVAVGIAMAAVAVQSATLRGASVYETINRAEPTNVVDSLVGSVLQEKGIEPAQTCPDEVFVRRIYLDMIGTLPTPAEVQAFLADTRDNRRAALIDALFQRDEFADYWALKWCDVLRVKAEFPINLWPNAVQAYHHWVREAVRENMPYDRFARALLTSSGSNFRVPPANFYRAIQGREPSAIAEAVAQTFMGARTRNWPQPERDNLTAFFSRLAYKKTAEWKEEIVYLNPAPAEPLKVTFPDGTSIQLRPDDDPRVAFTDWLLTPNNPWFARAVVNRVWCWLMGRGIIHEPDDIRPDNPPVNEKLLAYLERELADSKYDLRHIYRLILNSRTYAQSSIPRSNNPDAEKLFAFYAPRRLDAEVLADVLHTILGGGDTYSSAVPEPFTFIPEYQRTISLADGSVSSAFLELFGRPARDTGLDSERNMTPTDGQRRYLLNSSDIQQRIQASKPLYSLILDAQGDRFQMIRAIYMYMLSRQPSDEELKIANTYFQRNGMTYKQAEEDLVWALINTKEFLYRH